MTIPSKSLLFLCCVGLTLPAAAQNLFPSPKTFTVTQACNAVTAIRSQADPVALTVGQAYVALGENKPTGATYAYIDVDGQRRWVDLGCGQYADGSAAPAPASAPAASTTVSTECLPFFDDIDNPIDVGFGGKADLTPPPPVLDAFDLAVNDVCGAAGKAVSRDEFQALLRAHPAVLQDIQTFTDGQVYADRPKPADEAAFLNDLTDAWFNAQAFDHIFCGEPKAGGPLGGLHFAGRYWQLQQSGTACRLNNPQQAEVAAGAVYTMGARMKIGAKYSQSAYKGFGYTYSASDILKAATWAFYENPVAADSSTACLLPVSDDGKTLNTVFVARSTGIRTFYPDATPSTTDPACQKALTLP